MDEETLDDTTSVDKAKVMSAHEQMNARILAARKDQMDNWENTNNIKTTPLTGNDKKAHFEALDKQFVDGVFDLDQAKGDPLKTPEKHIAQHTKPASAEGKEPDNLMTPEKKIAGLA
jgi:hypothetical protein